MDSGTVSTPFFNASLSGFLGFRVALPLTALALGLILLIIRPPHLTPMKAYERICYSGSVLFYSVVVIIACGLELRSVMPLDLFGGGMAFILFLTGLYGACVSGADDKNGTGSSLLFVRFSTGALIATLLAVVSVYVFVE